MSRASKLVASGLVAAALAALVTTWACSSEDQPVTTHPVDDAGTDASEMPDAPADAEADAAPPSFCSTQGLAAIPFDDKGPYGSHRGDVAGDFTVPLVGGTTWSFEESFTGCESYVFIPDSLRVSDADPTSIWESDKDLAALVKKSPKNVHYFFVTKKGNPTDAGKATSAMQTRVDGVIAKLSAGDADHWKAHLHVVSDRAVDLTGWLGTIFAANGAIGFAIDRAQRIHGTGYYSDVARFDPALQAMMLWPFKSNLAYAANEPIYLNAQADEAAALAADGATVVTLWNGEILSEFAETDAMLPSAQAMAGFDTLTIEVSSSCPDPDKIEIGNCGAWDYLASLSLREDDADAGADAGGGTNVEVARFITSYHRETHWVVDASPWLARLKQGGLRHFRWDFAPSWNVQPTGTKLSLRFSNQKKGYVATDVVPLFSGGDFGSAYDAAYMPIDVPIPADAKRTELWVLVTGHGAGTNQCSEFCNHQHEFTVAGQVHTKSFPMAGSDSGCVPETANGMVPNQAGTWWFGRGGWCPGKQVDPWVVDVSGEVTPGSAATISYRGLYGGQPPPDGSGNIVLASYLVIYR